MPIIKLNSKILHFVHIPKTGGSYITSYLRRMGPIGSYSREPLPSFKIPPQHFHREIYQHIYPAHLIEGRFAVIRDPLQRIVSEFNYRVRRANSTPSSLQKAKSYAAESDSGVEFFDDFNHWVESSLGRATEYPDALENHLRPQVDFLDSTCKVFTFEAGLNAVLDWVDAKVGDKRSREGLDRNLGAEVEPKISASSKRLIKAFYADDIALFERLSSSPR